MTTIIRANRILTALAAAGIAIMLTACAVPAGAGSKTPTATVATKEAGIFSKDVNMCIVNSSGTDLTTVWSAVSTSDQQKTLRQGDSTCGEGPEPAVAVSFGDGSSISLAGVNPAIGWPEVDFNSTTKTVTTCDDSGECITFPQKIDYVSLSEGESKSVLVKGRHYTLTRSANNDWVNFTVMIKD